MSQEIPAGAQQVAPDLQGLAELVLLLESQLLALQDKLLSTPPAYLQGELLKMHREAQEQKAKILRGMLERQQQQAPDAPAAA